MGGSNAHLLHYCLKVAGSRLNWAAVERFLINSPEWAQILLVVKKTSQQAISCAILVLLSFLSNVYLLSFIRFLLFYVARFEVASSCFTVSWFRRFLGPFLLRPMRSPASFRKATERGSHPSIFSERSHFWRHRRRTQLCRILFLLIACRSAPVSCLVLPLWIGSQALVRSRLLGSTFICFAVWHGWGNVANILPSALLWRQEKRVTNVWRYCLPTRLSEGHALTRTGGGRAGSLAGPNRWEFGEILPPCLHGKSTFFEGGGENRTFLFFFHPS